MTDKLTELRRELDAVDAQLINQLAIRFTLTRQVGEFKRDHDLPPMDPEREKEIFMRLGRLAGENGVDPDLVQDLFERIITRVRADHAALKETSNA